ncbi:MAG: peptidoglycan editing factor PgeF [Patescibacteria group bacterium]|nr:peptidoglycan editing factor PgeF [Patescibacteria group bacterium]
MQIKHASYFSGITSKQDGQMKPYGDGRDEVALLNRKKYFEKVGLDIDKSVAVNLVHGIKVARVDQNYAGQIVQDADALITNVADLILTITVADCVPIIFFDQVNKAVGIAHAGWRGVVGNIVSNVVEAMQENFDTNQSDLTVNVGPHIQKCHFEIQNDVADKFSDYPKSIVKQDGKIFVDLQSAIKHQLTSIGVQPQNIEVSDECTYCLTGKYFSFRRDKPEILLAMMAYVGLYSLHG